MSTALEVPHLARARRVVGQSEGLRLMVALALARVEGRRLVRHPIFLAGLALSALFLVVLTWHEAPVLHREALHLPAILLPLGGAAFLTANVATLRSRRHGTDELYDALASAPADRTAGHLLSLAWAAGAAVLFAGAAMGYLWLIGGVGILDVRELLVGPATVAVSGAFGILVARWLPSPALGPLVLVAFVAATVFALDQLGAVPGRREWILPYGSAAAGPLGDASPELLIRPTGWHLLYLAALALATAALALLRHGFTSRRLALGAAAVVLAVLSASAQLRPPSAAERRALVSLVKHPARYQICETKEDVRFCAYPAYEGWIDRWAAATLPVLEEIPTTARPSGLVVRQVLGIWGSDLPLHALRDLETRRQGRWGAVIHAGHRWGRGEAEGRYELNLALAVAGRSLGLPAVASEIVLTRTDIDRIRRAGLLHEHLDEATLRAGGRWDSCSAIGQARAAVAIWLAAEATPNSEAALRAIVEQLPYGVVRGRGDSAYFEDNGPAQFNLQEFTPLAAHIIWGKAETNYALQMLDRPEAEMRRAIRHHWAPLTRQGARTQMLVRLLHLRPLPTPAQQLRRAGLDPSEAGTVMDADATGSPPCR